MAHRGLTFTSIASVAAGGARAAALPNEHNDAGSGGGLVMAGGSPAENGSSADNKFLGG